MVSDYPFRYLQSYLIAGRFLYVVDIKIDRNPIRGTVVIFTCPIKLPKSWGTTEI